MNYCERMNPNMNGMGVSMRLLKSISLFVLYPLCMLGLGFYAGVEASHFFYPEGQDKKQESLFEGLPVVTPEPEEAIQEPVPVPDDRLDYGVVMDEETAGDEDAEEVLFSAETLCVDTAYVLSFSRERVVVQMNYKYVQPSSSFYLAAYDNKVIVYLEDKKTVYIETGILLDSLPGEIQQSIMEMMWIENEEKLYNFLENYSS